MATRAHPPPSPAHARQAVLATAAYTRAGGKLPPDAYVGANGQVSQEPGWWDSWGKQVIPLLGLGLGTWAAQAIQNHVAPGAIPAGDFTPSPGLQGQGEVGVVGMSDALPTTTSFPQDAPTGNSFRALVPLLNLIRGKKS